MFNEPSCYEEVAQMDESKLVMEEKLMMMNKNQTQSSAEDEYNGTAATPNQAIGLERRTKHINVKFHAIKKAEKNGNVSECIEDPKSYL
ncbi:hypothetical protein LWI28_025972 [Acer negundo]|uniref:Uncharacterized protein n=1 Tax=Acer negundo TaxID=4023 RepID=A0AAD5NMG5_ACENE|nr:hypothetical protein LWI28_025972 [Acer negundo]